MDNSIPIFKYWVPDWLTKGVLFILLLPSLVLFFLPMANISAAAGYYGGEPADIQFAVALFYAGYVGFYALERRFFVYLATKEYFLILILMQIASSLICYYTKTLAILFPVRFIQGMLFASIVNLSLALMFTRLHTERAREVSFSVFFGMLLCALPFNNLVTADLIDAYNFNIVYKGAIFSYIPGILLVLFTMNNIRMNARFPLYKLDWQSFGMYSVLLYLLGYIMIFGQEYYWLHDTRIRNCLILAAITLVMYVLRQRAMKRPYISLGIFRFRNYKIGILLLFIMYISRFAAGVTTSYFSVVLRFDPIHVSYMNLFNVAGLVVGVVVACNMVLQKKHIRYLWLPGFSLLLIFHIAMFFLFVVQADEINYCLPLFIQGVGVGMLMVPTIVFAISSVPVAMGSSAAAICLAVRYAGFCVSIGVMNYFELFERGRHYSAFQDHLSRTDMMVKHNMEAWSQKLFRGGLIQTRAVKGADKLLVNAVNTQTQIRYAMDYYEWMSGLLILTILLIILFPYLNRTVVYLRSKRLSPA